MLGSSLFTTLSKDNLAGPIGYHPVYISHDSLQVPLMFLKREFTPKDFMTPDFFR